MADPIRLLHVEDDAALAEVAETFLRREVERIEVRTATTVDEGMDVFDAVDVDCVVSDYDLPHRNGIDLLTEVRAAAPELPFILFTGKGSEEIAGEAISAGVTDYLQKSGGTSQYTVLANRIRNAVSEHRARRQLRETERTLSELANRSDDILYVFDGAWEELAFINAAYEEIWGGAIEALEEDPQAFLERIHPEDRDAARDSMETLAEGKSDEVTYRVVRSEGDVRWVRGKSKPILDERGEVRRIVGYVRDITRRVQRERDLEYTREYYETLLSHQSDYLLVVDESGRITYASPSVEQVTGFDPDSLVGSSAFEYVHEEDVSFAAQRFATLLSNPDATVSTEYRAKMADGSTRRIEVRGRNLLDDEYVNGLLVNVRDIEDR